MQEYKLINRPTDENEIGTTHIIDVRNKLDADGWATQEDVYKRQTLLNNIAISGKPSSLAILENSG